VMSPMLCVKPYWPNGQVMVKRYSLRRHA